LLADLRVGVDVQLELDVALAVQLERGARAQRGRHRAERVGIDHDGVVIDLDLERRQRRWRGERRHPIARAARRAREIDRREVPSAARELGRRAWGRGAAAALGGLAAHDALEPLGRRRAVGGHRGLGARRALGPVRPHRARRRDRHGALTSRFASGHLSKSLKEPAVGASANPRRAAAAI
jgi:hypothetical protein